MSVTEQADVGQAPPVQVITATRNLKSQPFISGDDPIVKRKAWDDWLEEIEHKFRYFKITEPLDKKKMHSSFMAGKKSLAWRKFCQTPQMALTTTRS